MLPSLLIVIIVLLISISLHEMMHALVSYSLGDDTAKEQGRITLNPFAHIDIIMTIAMPALLFMLGFPPIGAAKPVPFNPARLRWGEYGMALVAVAGPLTNLLLAILGGLAYAFIGDYQLLQTFLEIFIAVNVAFFVFNMIPIPPLDGSRVLYVFMPEAVRRLMDSIERFGLIAVIFILVIIVQVFGQYIITINERIINILL